MLDLVPASVAPAQCQAAAKAAFVVAASTYLKTMAETANTNDTMRVVASLEPRLRQAIRTALAGGGVSQADFPPDTRSLIAALAPAPALVSPRCATFVQG